MIATTAIMFAIITSVLIFGHVSGLRPLRIFKKIKEE